MKSASRQRQTFLCVHKKKECRVVFTVLIIILTMIIGKLSNLMNERVSFLLLLLLGFSNFGKGSHT